MNDLVPSDNLAYLLRYDSVYGRYEEKVMPEMDALIIGDRSIPLFHEKDPAALPWVKLQVDVVLECTGVFTTGEDLKKHLKAGTKHAILPAPARDEETLSEGRRIIDSVPRHGYDSSHLPRRSRDFGDGSITRFSEKRRAGHRARQ